jgi:phosphotriesterase-related protein
LTDPGVGADRLMNVGPPRSLDLDDRGKVLTVLGAVDPESLGVTLTHEHIFCDLRRSLIEPRAETRAVEGLKVSLENLWLIRRDWMSNVDNVQLSDYDTAVDELMLLKDAGGRTIVDLTVEGIAPRYSQLKRVAQDTGLNIVAATGYYVSKTHPKEVAQKGVDDLASEMEGAVVRGIADTGVRAGIIKIGVGGTLEDGKMKIHKDEEKLLRAASSAQRATGVAITVHTPRHIASERDRPPSWWGLRILDILSDAGADIDRVVIGHLDRCAHEDMDLQVQIAKRGAYVEYDVWGKDHYFRSYRESNISDSVRIERIETLIGEGCADRLLLSQDVCMKLDLTRYGGYGYSHILRNIVPMMKDEGIGEDQIHRMLVENPRRALTIGS